MKFNKLIPELYVYDIEKSSKFYVDILGFKVEYERKSDKFIFLSLNGSQIMIQQQNETWKTGSLEHPYGRGINFQIEVENAGSLIKLLKDSNWPIKVELKESWYEINGVNHGQKEFLVMDPDGYLLRFFEDMGIKKI